MRIAFTQLGIGVIAALYSSVAVAETDGGMSSGDVIWIVTASALVFFMQAGFALLESGLSRVKNAVNVLMKNYMDVCIGSLIFWAIGYGLMFGHNITGFVGTSMFFVDSSSTSTLTLLLFQTMFAATAATIASGAMAERVRYHAYLIGALFIVGFIYPVFGSWVWGGAHGGNGWLSDLGFVDFAGSTVVHSVGAWCALAGIIVAGPRIGRFDPSTDKPREIPGHNLTLVALGGFILWLGWFGFNGGSTLAASADVGMIAFNTHISAAAGAAGALIWAKVYRQPILLTATVNGSLGGLVAITAGCASMSPMFAVVTGLIAGSVVIIGQRLLLSLKLDDVVGAIPVHGFAGAWGTLAAGLFYQGDLFNVSRVVVQLVGIGAAFLWTFTFALLLYWLIDRVFGLKASSADQRRGLDVTEHNELGYPEFTESPLQRPVQLSP
ncbi:MAG: ammonium transporter [Pseudomonadales bacterium]|nr:ammonium transporter [Pseudomonadales bacterium]